MVAVARGNGNIDVRALTDGSPVAVLSGHALAVTDLTTTTHTFGAGAAPVGTAPPSRASGPSSQSALASSAPAAARVVSGRRAPPPAHSPATACSSSIARYPTLLSAGRDGTVRAWDVSSGRETARVRHGSPLWSLSAYGDRVFSGGADGRVVVWSAHTAAPLVELRVPRQAVCVCPFGTTVLVGTSQGFLVCFDSRSGERIWTSRVFREVRSVGIQRDRHILLGTSICLNDPEEIHVISRLRGMLPLRMFREVLSVRI